MATPTQTDYAFGDTITFSSSVVGVSSATLTDSAGNVLSLSVISDTTLIIPALRTGATKILIESGVSLSVTNGTDTSTGSINTVAPDGYAVTTLSSIPSTAKKNDWVFGLSPSAEIGDQTLYGNPSFVTHNSDGTVTLTGSESYTFFTIRAQGGAVEQLRKTVVRQSGHVVAGSKSVTVAPSVVDSGITSVAGSLSKGGTLTISGSDFGGGPAFNEVLYDACDGSGTRSTTDAIVGTWDEVDSVNSPYDATYETGGRDGGNCLRGLRYDPVEEDSFETRQVVTFPNSSKFYMSFWYKWMPNTFWPTSLATGRDTWVGVDPSSKQSWVMYDADGYATGKVNDVVHGGNPFYSGILGNDTPDMFPSHTLGEQWEGAHRNDWVRFTLCISVDADRTVEAPIFYENIYPTAVGQKIFSSHKKWAVMANSAFPEVPTVYNRAEFFPWYRGGSLSAQGATLESDVDHRMDDIYFSWGENALARVEIGDNTDYNLCTERVLAYPAGSDWWTDSEINVKIETGTLDFDSPLYVFVIHSDNKRIMSYPLSTLQGL